MNRFFDFTLSISQETIDRIKGQIDIVDVLSDFLTMKRVGQNYRALSPFTNEKTPSFYISPSKGIFKDFSSGKGGDAINFIMEHEGLSYLETLKYLAKKYGIEIVEEEQTDEQIQKQNERESLYIVINYAAEYYRDMLWNHADGKAIGLSYFKERGFTDQVIKKFELGYSLDQWDGFAKAASAKGYSTDILEKAGLLISKDDRFYDRFRGRVTFPIHNVTGKVIAFGARTLSNNKKQPKYINSPETEIYHKSKILYGIHQAKQAIRNGDNCYLVEGYTDVISLHLSGVENVVASSGTSLTDDQIKLIGRYSENITVLFDGDAAGLRASIRGIDMILEKGMNVKTVVFPEGEDPDSYSQKLGTTKFQEYLQEQSQDFIKFKVSLLTSEAAGDPLKKAETIREIVESIAKIPDPIKRTVYIQECSKILEIDESVLISEQNKILIRQNKEKRNKVKSKEEAPPDVRDIEEVSTKPEVTNFISLQEKESIRLLINYGSRIVEGDFKFCDYILKELEDIEFDTPIYAEIISLYKQKLQEGVVIDTEYLIHNGSNAVKQEIINLEMEMNRYELSKNWYDRYQILVPNETDILDNVVFTNIQRLKFRVIQKIIQSNVEALKEEEDLAKQEELLQVISAYKKMEMDVAKILGNVISK
ncbi:DNA primase [Fulvivirgaceae bacterium BMA10]|uniref:DNA primase n=1 Tax=Splendidivirga corallicola TaxID=3051826 RepID=A0ABT8KTQ0_9BACT|nr:DNA primase [Fulvivirgaceae bacterium BMA10]